MARWKPPGPDNNPGKNGFSRIPEPAGGGATVRSMGLSGAKKAKIVRGVGRAVNKEVREINAIAKRVKKRIEDERFDRAMDKHMEEGPPPRRRQTSREMSGSNYWNSGRGYVKEIKASNSAKNKQPKKARVLDVPLEVKGNPFRSEFKMKMDMASKGKTERGKPKGDNDNRRK